MDSVWKHQVEDFFNVLSSHNAADQYTLEIRTFTGTGGDATDMYGSDRTWASGSGTTYTADVAMDRKPGLMIATEGLNTDPTFRFDGVRQNMRWGRAAVSATKEGKSMETLRDEFSRLSGSAGTSAQYERRLYLCSGTSREHARINDVQSDHIAGILTVVFSIPDSYTT